MIDCREHNVARLSVARTGAQRLSLVWVQKQYHCHRHAHSHAHTQIPPPRATHTHSELARIAPNGIDVVLEGVGGEMLAAALDALSPVGLHTYAHLGQLITHTHEHTTPYHT